MNIPDVITGLMNVPDVNTSLMNVPDVITGLMNVPDVITHQMNIPDVITGPGLGRKHSRTVFPTSYLHVVNCHIGKGFI